MLAGAKLIRPVRVGSTCEFWDVAIAVQFKRLPVELHCSVLKLLGRQCVTFCLSGQCDFVDLLSVGIDD